LNKNGNRKKTNKYHCRFCIYLEAEEQGINCFEICPQKDCLKNEVLPKQMINDMKRLESGKDV